MSFREVEAGPVKLLCCAKGPDANDMGKRSVACFRCHHVLQPRYQQRLKHVPTTQLAVA